MKGVLCQIFRSTRQNEMYLYVNALEGLSRVPEELLERFGEPEPAMSLVLNAERKLVRADVSRVLEALDAPGYYLQMPPRPEALVEQQLQDQFGG